MLGFIASATKVLAGLAVNKAVSVYVGPAGLALIGQFQGFSQAVVTAAQGAINSGVTKYTAEYGRYGNRILVLLSTSGKISFISTAIVAPAVILFSEFASKVVLKSADYTYIFVLLGFTIPFPVINNLMLSILNGLKETGVWVKISIIQTICGLLLALLLVIYFGLDGALIALVINQVAYFFIALWLRRNHQLIRFKFFVGEFDYTEAIKLGKFAAMALTSALAAPLSHMTIRAYIGETIGWAEAGYWQAIWYISSMYLMAVTTTINVYYLPRLSEITEKKELRREILGGYMILMPIVILSSVMIFLLRDFVIGLLFTPDFAPMRDLFFAQLVGDVLKLAAWIVSYLMLAKALTKTFILSEIFFSLSFVFLSIFLIDQFGLIGVTYAFALNYGVYFLTMIFATKRQWCGQ